MERAGTLERGLAVLRVLTAEPERRLRATDVVRATGLARSVVDRVLATLVHLGYARTADRDVLPAPRLTELGEAYLACSGLRDTLGPIAARLAAELDESVFLAVRDGDGARFVAGHARRGAVSVTFRPGDLVPARRCAAGLALLDPSAPYALDDQLAEPGLTAVALPVRGPGGAPVCAVSVVSHTSRHSAPELAAHTLPALRATITTMEAALTDAAEPAATETALTEPGEPAAAAETALTEAAESAPPGPVGGAVAADAERPGPVAGVGVVEAAPAGPVAASDASRAAKEELGAGYLRSLDRGLAVLVALGAARGGLTLAAAAKATGLPRATARRAVQTLEALGYAAPGDGGRFVLLPKVLELGYAALSRRTLSEIATPHLAALVARVRESASVAVLSGDDVRYVARVPTVRIMSVDITVGTRFPAYATSMGRVLLADLPEERLAAIVPRSLTPRTVTGAAELAAVVRRAAEDGYALVDQELEEGVRSIAVPVRDRLGRTVAAVNVAAHAGRATPDDLRRDVLPALRETAARIEADLAHLPWATAPDRLPDPS
ncbi:IclR family transcriptional regulator C-terminal domain-containing protein [Nonomuraea pusilla]|uniref:IclR family transcriptional regulator domain-containing protein n=1 Tax=Nonomuraea pusilla TaxID=46177 RepID=UPI003324343E